MRVSPKFFSTFGALVGCTGQSLATTNQKVQRGVIQLFVQTFQL
jgi:hypothetical protein